VRPRQLIEERTAFFCDVAAPQESVGPPTLLSTSVEHLRHSNAIPKLSTAFASRGDHSLFSHLAIRRIECSSIFLALHLHCPARGNREGMLKITITNTAREERWTLQGRLVAPWVHPRKASWKRAKRTGHGRRCIVNLDEVAFIDRSGERVLRYMSN